ncbi:GyrI-like domain-containing protein [Tissierella carlieri]|uniref:GyrI-like domain-containing protein n=1 Tax=Tissierella carlieri TaxID=689904 RepID=A0ABT1SDE4_9FIRM|nr:GyrI-like domain-containing protein [Tissierella carlieri]MCQ4924507.1 GyrI-like domain-containing protein [Tissierella carlieri]
MAKLVNLQINQLPEVRIIGKAVYLEMAMKENPIPEFWEKCFEDGTFTRLEELKEYHIDSSYVGWMGDWGIDNGKFTYICGMLMKTEAPVPEGFICRDIPSSKVAIGWIQGLEKDVYPVSHEFTQKAMEEKGYRLDESASWCMELYNCPRFTTPMDNGEIILDYYIPCKTV